MDAGWTPANGYSISSLCEPNSSGELENNPMLTRATNNLINRLVVKFSYTTKLNIGFFIHRNISSSPLEEITQL